MKSKSKLPTQSEQKDLELAQKIKPKLRKFVITEQRKNAEKLAKEKAAEEKLMLGNTEIIQRASKLACLALLDKKVWQTITPTLEWRWTKFGIGTPELAREMHSDIAGFTTYLVREYNTFLKYKAVGKGYLSPMDEKNLEFFWAKFNADLKLLIEAEMKRVKAGNKSVILGTKDGNGNIIPIKEKIIN